ncbi:hypothetical protein TNCV_1413991 [Trichonephila clavipes]|nr:hypothetical protein TNCV_1413991 [Trichonephila clavipes]
MFGSNSKRSKRSKASDLSHQLSTATGTKVSKQTVDRRLGHTDLWARRPRTPGTCQLQGNLIELQGKIAHLGETSLGSRIDLHLQMGTMAGQIYKEILR